MNGRAYASVQWTKSSYHPDLYFVSFAVYSAWSGRNSGPDSYATVDDFGNLVAVTP